MGEKEMLKEIFNRIHIGFYPVGWKEEGKVVKMLLNFLLLNTPIGQGAISILLKGDAIERFYNIESNEISDDLKNLISIIDKMVLVNILVDDENRIREIANIMVKYDLKYFPVYNLDNGKLLPFFIEREDDINGENVNSIFVPLIQEWDDTEEGLIIANKGNKGIFLLNAFIKTIKIETEKDFKELLSERIDLYENLKSKYLKEANLIEELYQIKQVN